MKKYTIEVYGKGGEAYVFNLTDEQKLKLSEGNVESDEMDVDEIADILNVNDVYDTDNIYIGPYPQPSSFGVKVINENGDKVWESKDDWELDFEEYEYAFEKPNVLIVEDYIKGIFFTYELEIEEDFDYKKLKPIVTEISESVELLTELTYNGVNLNSFKDFGDYWSKGLTFYLN